MVTVFSKNNCMQCKMVKKWLTDKSISFEEVNMDENPDAVANVKALGFMSAPVVTKGEFAFSGFRPAELAKL